MEKENKARRPRIGDNKGAGAASSTKFERVEYGSRPSGASNYERPSRPSYNNDRPAYNNDRPRNYENNNSNYGEARRPYNNNRSSYNPNFSGGNRPYNNNHQERNSYRRNNDEQPERNYNNANSYNDSYSGEQRPFNRPRPVRSNNGEAGGYSPRPNRYNNEGGGYNANRGGSRPYNNNGGEGGYNRGGNRPYNNGGNRYNNNNGEGGYNRGGNRPYNNGGNRYNNNGEGGERSYDKKPYTANSPQTVLRKKVVYDAIHTDPGEAVRLNKFMANAGVCSRREADEFIKEGQVTVNGVVMTELGTKITYGDKVEFAGKEVSLEQKIYVLLNKPKDCVTTSDDPQGRLTVMDIVRSACKERIYPVGRLDRNTTGVLLLTNDGDIASKLTHPKFVKKKIYHVWTDRDVTEEDMQRIADGLELEDGKIEVDAVSYATETDKNQVGIELHSGRNRIVRRIFEALGYRVIKLDRVYFAGLTKKNLPRGRWRYLSQKEVDMLRMGAFE